MVSMGLGTHILTSITVGNITIFLLTNDRSFPSNRRWNLSYLRVLFNQILTKYQNFTSSFFCYPRTHNLCVVTAIPVAFTISPYSFLCGHTCTHAHTHTQVNAHPQMDRQTDRQPNRQCAHTYTRTSAHAHVHIHARCQSKPLVSVLLVSKYQPHINYDEHIQNGWKCLAFCFYRTVYASILEEVFGWEYDLFLYLGLNSQYLRTGLRRPRECHKLQVISRKRATNYRTLLRKMTCKDKASYDPTPRCSGVASHTQDLGIIRVYMCLHEYGCMCVYWHVCVRIRMHVYVYAKIPAPHFSAFNDFLRVMQMFGTMHLFVY